MRKRIADGRIRKENMIKIMLQGRKQSDTYLTTIRRQCWRGSLPLQLMKATVRAEISILYYSSSSSIHSSDVYKQQPGRLYIFVIFVKTMYLLLQENRIVKIQAVWRGYRVRQAFLTLFHQPDPPFKVVCNFAHHLDFSTDDYQRNLQLQVQLQ